MAGTTHPLARTHVHTDTLAHAHLLITILPRPSSQPPPTASCHHSIECENVKTLIKIMFYFISFRLAILLLLLLFLLPLRIILLSLFCPGQQMMTVLLCFYVRIFFCARHTIAFSSAILTKATNNKKKGVNKQG